MPSNSEIVTSVRHGLRGIARFSGRDPRVRFWPYAIAVMLVGNAIGMVVAIPMFLRSFVNMRELAERHPDQFVVRETPTSYSISYVGNDPAVAAAMMPGIEPFLVMVWAVAAMTAILLAAACTRRLHDRSISGRWLMAPVVFSMPALWLMPGLFDELGASSGMIGAGFYWTFAAIFIGNMLYIVSLIALATLMALRGTVGDNRYGPAPTP